MNKIRIGTIVPGNKTAEFLPEFMEMGFECFALNHHMVFEDKNLTMLLERVKKAADGKPVEISSIGYYCNPLQNEEQLQALNYLKWCRGIPER